MLVNRYVSRGVCRIVSGADGREVVSFIGT